MGAKITEVSEVVVEQEKKVNLLRKQQVKVC